MQWFINRGKYLSSIVQTHDFKAILPWSYSISSVLIFLQSCVASFFFNIFYCFLFFQLKLSFWIFYETSKPHPTLSSRGILAIFYGSEYCAKLAGIIVFSTVSFWEGLFWRSENKFRDFIAVSKCWSWLKFGSQHVTAIHMQALHI